MFVLNQDQAKLVGGGDFFGAAGNVSNVAGASAAVGGGVAFGAAQVAGATGEATAVAAGLGAAGFGALGAAGAIGWEVGTAINDAYRDQISDGIQSLMSSF